MFFRPENKIERIVCDRPPGYCRSADPNSQTRGTVPENVICHMRTSPTTDVCNLVMDLCTKRIWNLFFLYYNPLMVITQCVINGNWNINQTHVLLRQLPNSHKRRNACLTCLRMDGRSFGLPAWLSSNREWDNPPSFLQALYFSSSEPRPGTVYHLPERSSLSRRLGEWVCLGG